MSHLGYDILTIALTTLIPLLIFAFPKAYQKAKLRRDKKEAQDKEQDDNLQLIATTVREISGDMQCLFEIQRLHTEISEDMVIALKKLGANGNTDSAMSKINELRKIYDGRLISKIGCKDKINESS
jgi:hypothetical protein